ncbi:MAG TPA: hypothetical protein VNA24_31475 [Hyalangium sp.]|nr:hypothetical protein [Hyalangium sp.]
MSRTGSTCEQKSPTKWRLRLGLALVVGVLLMATSASAGWSRRTVPGSPNDVRVWAPGVFSVATDAGAWLERANGTTSFIPTDDKAEGSFHNPANDCFMALRHSGSEEGIDPPCDRDEEILDSASIRLRTNSAGVGFLFLDEGRGTDRFHLYRAESPGTSRWEEITRLGVGPVQPSNALGALLMGGSEDVLFAIKEIGGVTLYWYRDFAEADTHRMDAPVSAPVVRDSEVVDLFPAGGDTPTALFSWGNSLYRGTLVQGGSSFTELSYPGGEGTITALDVNTGVSTQHGDGFGMATVQRDGGVTLLSAVPAAKPQDIGKEWRVNPTLPADLTAPRALECYGSSFCVIAQGAATANNVFVYTNDAPPTLAVSSDSPAPFILSSGTNRTINVRAPDADGDAALVKVEPSSFSEHGFSMTTTPVNGGVDLLLDATTVCANVSRNITISATDGMDSHATVGTYALQVQRALAPTAPTISPRPNIAVPAGGMPLLLTATASAPCGVEEFTWTELSPDAGRLALSGERKQDATFTPPRIMCRSVGEIHAYRVRAVEDGGVSSLPTDVTIQVLPWGAPNAPFNDGGVEVTIQAGESQVLHPDMPSHECDKPGAGFPGVETVWQLVDGGLAPPGVELRTQDDRVIAGSSAITPTLRVETDECTDTVFDLSVQHFTDGGFGVRGPESHVRVIVKPDGNPTSGARLELSPGPPAPGAAAGSASVAGLRCPTGPGDGGLQARIFLTSDGGIAREGTFPVPGPWQFEMDDVCLDTVFTLRGELVGEPDSAVEGNDVTVRSLQRPRLQPMEDPYLTARCGQPATGILEQRPLHPCSGLSISWTRDGGVELTQSDYTGQRIEVATQSTEFAELIGQSVVMHMSATTLEEATLDQEIPIRSELFVELDRRTEKATGADVDLIGVSVELRNTTECGVSQVDHLERLEGAEYVPGSMRFNGSPVEPEVEGDTLRVRGLVLEGSTSGQLTYVVRPRLLENARFEGQSFVRGVPVSRPQEEPPTGCGCSGAGSGLAALGLAGLAMALRRRRVR